MIWSNVCFAVFKMGTFILNTYRYRTVCFQLYIVRSREHYNFSAYEYFCIRLLILAGILENSTSNKKIIMILQKQIYLLKSIVIFVMKMKVMQDDWAEFVQLRGG